MDLWKILVLGTLRINCNWDFDKVHDMANNHHKFRQMLGHRETDFDSNYALQTIRDNIALLTPAILNEINQVAVKAGRSIIHNNDNAISNLCREKTEKKFAIEVTAKAYEKLYHSLMSKKTSESEAVLSKEGKPATNSKQNVEVAEMQLKILNYRKHWTI